jgi:hypothetical protein
MEQGRLENVQRHARDPGAVRFSAFPIRATPKQRLP